MFSFMFVGMILLLLLLPGVAGIVLLIVGIARKKPALWGTGIGLMALAMLAVVVGGGYALFASATRLAPGPMAAPTVVARARAAVADEFSSYVGVGLPEAARVTASESREERLPGQARRRPAVRPLPEGELPAGDVG